MTHRRTFIGTLALAAAVAACGRQDAGPTVDQTETGSIQVLVQSDTTNATAFTYSNRAGIAVALYPLGDTLVLRRATTQSNGKVVFRGLAPGRYVVKPIVRANTTFASPESTIVTVQWGVVDSTTTFQFRQGGRVAGFISVQYIDQTGSHIVRFPEGKAVQLLEDTSVAQTGPREYKTIYSSATDAAGNYELFGAPTRHRFGIRFQAGLNDQPDSLRFLSDTLNGFQTVHDPIVTYNDAGGILGGSMSRNLLFGYTSAIVVRAFRDYNKNGVNDAATDSLIGGDTIRFQLKNAAGDRVLATGAISVPTSGTRGQTATISSVAPGDYKVVLLRALTRFGTTPGFSPKDTTVDVTVPNTRTRVTVNLPLQPQP